MAKANNRKKRLRKASFITITGLFVLAIVLFCNLIDAPCASAANEFKERPMVEITVVYGDTLWELAEEYRSDYNEDIRALIHDIKEINGLRTAAINPGDKLYIPLD